MSQLFANDNKPRDMAGANPDPANEDLRGITSRWRARSKTQSTGDLLSRVLRARGLQDESESFLNPSLRQMHDPLLIPDLEKAADRILRAAKGGERIVIFGDYDVDGVTASAVLIHTLRAIAPNADLQSYIPHRIEEGYGLNSDALKKLHADGASLVVTVDCGITAVEPALTAKNLGMDLIITDHHNPPASLDDMPEAYAVVHPRRPDSNYPYGELCGAGVAYKLAWRMCIKHSGSEKVHPELRQVLVEMLGFTALGSIADVVPLLDENRVIVKHGLRQIPFSHNEGLCALISASGLDSDKIDTEDVGFRLAPRLNAIGRLGNAADALHLMTNARGREATELAEQLSRINDKRKAIGESIFSQAEEMAKAAGMCDSDRRAIVLRHPEWHPGVVGIVCSRLVERYARPVILMLEDGEICKGSGRSIEDFNLHAGLEQCSPFLTGFGGHDMAAGMRCRTDQFEEFSEAFIRYANEHLEPQDLINTTKYDAELSLSELDVQAVKLIESLAPFGAGHPRVRLLIRDAKLNGDASPFGRNGSHLSLRICDRGQHGTGLRVVAWNWAKYREQIPRGAPIEAIIEPKLSTWNGRTTVEPILVDLRVT